MEYIFVARNIPNNKMEVDIKEGCTDWTTPTSSRISSEKYNNEYAQ